MLVIKIGNDDSDFWDPFEIEENFGIGKETNQLSGLYGFIEAFVCPLTTVTSLPHARTPL